MGYFLLDAFDTISKHANWDTTLQRPVSSLPLHLQIFYTVSFCILVTLGMSWPYDMTAAFFVVLGSEPAAWPPMFDSPLLSASLAEFWTRRWHHMYRYPFFRLAHPPWRIASRHFSPATARYVRVIAVFIVSAILHFALLYPMPVDEKHPHFSLFDPTTLFFYTVQPLGIFLESAVINPLSSSLSPPLRHAVRRAWGWIFLIWAARYWADIYIRRGMWDKKENPLKFSVVRGVLWGQWLQ